jgi:cytochrome P450
VIDQARKAERLTVFGDSMLNVDPPGHARLRDPAADSFSRTAMQALRAMATTIANELVERAPRNRPFDVIEDLARPLPVRMMCAILGLPTKDMEQLLEWALVLSTGTNSGLLELVADTTTTSTYAEMRAYFETQFPVRRQSPQNDLLNTLVSAHDAGTLTAEELQSTCALVLLAGFDTTTGMIGNSVLALLRFPDQMERLRSEPRLIPNAVEELLRYDPPIHATGRLALTDVEVGGEAIGSGDLVLCMMAAANRDPKVFAAPATVDVARRNAALHLAFAAGPHYCLGAPLARLEGEIVLATLLARFAEIRQAGTERWRSLRMRHGLASLPVAVVPA